MNAAEAIVQCLKSEDISHVFCVPGESYLPILDALFSEKTIQLISARHEGGAAFMAEGYAKASKKVGVVMATRGVGATNAAIGIHTARQDSTPMVVLLGQVARSFRGREGFQEIDVEACFRPLAKWAVEIDDAQRLPELLTRAFRIAQTGRPGPVVVALPEDVLHEQVDHVTFSKTIVPKPAPNEEDIQRIEQLLRSARRPVVIAGGGIIWSKAIDVLRLFAEKWSLPVMSSFRRHDVFPNDHPLYVGHLGLGTQRAIIETVEQADVVLAIGTRLSEVTTQDYKLLSTQQLIHIDIDYDVIGVTYSPHIGVVSDAKEALSRLLNIQLHPSWTDWVKERRKTYERFSSLPSMKRNVNEEMIHILQHLLPSEAIITNDAGNFASWLHSFFQFQQHTYIGPTSGAMGYGLPAAIGAKLANPHRPVVSLSGDGGFMMTIQELETAVRYNIPIISVVFNNQMYGTIRMYQELRYPKRVIGTDFSNISFASIARCFGTDSMRVETGEQFSSAFTTALQNNKPTVIEVMTDPNILSPFLTIEQARGGKQ
ncbi:thiamine pyrophosphate-binding protein [Anoxybacillus flavithermus]|uniref:Acetolactate synthase (Acetohydroxy-acid synthase) (Large subunit) n=1 Tax=Anoxybacillus flavithermus (strain DSM 21510 / WK1) TaxID=491915 RepID=B7GJG6_ANOFW|nr:thiamine pyrophosphate-binding protein [Anoxybacillus flavithermus]ACJ33615.1 Acetolactate synthase (acetohydroxy-acid synthase) (large subunit) [Anoxybacillus flavithermus WK1]